MSTSSAQPEYLTISNDIGIIAQEVDTVLPSSITMNDFTYDTENIITLTGSSISYTGNGSSVNTITIGSTGGAVGSTYNVGIGADITSTFNWKEPIEWVDSFPDWSRVDDMCQQYPSLEIALRNFQTVYQLVKDDYDNPTPKK